MTRRRRHTIFLNVSRIQTCALPISAVVGALGLTAGFCGSLLTPMGANFNIVPASILEMKNKNGVILKQVSVAVPLLAIHVVLMYFLAF